MNNVVTSKELIRKIRNQCLTFSGFEATKGFAEGLITLIDSESKLSKESEGFDHSTHQSNDVFDKSIKSSTNTEEPKAGWKNIDEYEANSVRGVDEYKPSEEPQTKGAEELNNFLQELADKSRDEIERGINVEYNKGHIIGILNGYKEVKSYANQAIKEAEQRMVEFVKSIEDKLIMESECHRQNLNGRESEEEIFRAGIDAMYGEILTHLKTNK